MKYRKKPIEIEAMQYTHDGPIPFGVCEQAHDSVHGGFHVHTLEGTSYNIKYGDWVIKGVRGEFYPIDNGIFLETYEKVI